MNEQFDNVYIYTAEERLEGSVSLRNMTYSMSMYFRENNCTTQDPFLDPDIQTPFTKPLIAIGGHLVFDLSFYSDITFLVNQFRICFNDSTQDFGVSLNFQDKASLKKFVAMLNQNVTLKGSNIKGFFKLYRFQPLIYDPKCKFSKNKKAAKDKIISDPITDSDLLLETHSHLIEFVTPSTRVRPISLEALKEAFSSHEAMSRVIRQHIIPDSKKADIWAFQIGLYPLDNIPKKFKDRYFLIRDQWKTITSSQFKRSKIYRSSFNSLFNCVETLSNSLLEIAPDENIKTVVFNVLMSLCHFYNHFHSHYFKLICIIQVFLRMFIKRIEHVDGGLIYYVHEDDNVSFDSDGLETILFNSMIYLSEKGELRRLYECKEESVTDELDDLLYLTHPQMYRLLYQQTNGISSLSPLFTTMLSSSLSYSKCTDIWITATSTRNFFEYIECIIAACLFFSFPNMVSSVKQTHKLDELAQQALSVLDINFLKNSALTLIDKMSDLISSNGLAI